MGVAQDRSEALRSAAEDLVRLGLFDLCQVLDEVFVDNELAALVALRRAVAFEIALTVRGARQEGFTWQEVATGLGVSASAAHKRYRFVDDDDSDAWKRFRPQGLDEWDGSG